MPGCVPACPSQLPRDPTFPRKLSWLLLHDWLKSAEPYPHEHAVAQMPLQACVPVNVKALQPGTMTLDIGNVLS